MCRRIALGELPARSGGQQHQRDQQRDHGVPSRHSGLVVVPHDVPDCSSGLSPIAGAARFVAVL